MFTYGGSIIDISYIRAWERFPRERGECIITPDIQVPIGVTFNMIMHIGVTPDMDTYIVVAHGISYILR